MWLRKYRILILVYAVGGVFGVREYLLSREKPEFQWLSPEGAVLVEMLERLNPDDPDTHYLKAMHALAAGDRAEFDRRLGLALASDMKHNELMLRFHAEYLLATGGDLPSVNAALGRWRRNFPFTAEPITFPLARGPRTPTQAEALEKALREVPWISDVRLGRIVAGGTEQWRVQIMVRRGIDIDFAAVHAAVDRALSL